MALREQIRDYIEHWNSDARPFVWTATVKDILSKVRHANETLETLH